MWQYDTINGKFIPGTLPAEGNITACYDRLSQEDELDGDSGSVVNQRDFLRKYCEEHHFQNVRHFSDDGYTGTNFDRPGFREMMRQVKAGEIDCIYIYRMRQISGKEQHLFRFFQQVMQHGIKVVTLEYSLRDRLHEYRLGMKIENYAARHKLPFPW